MYLSQILIEHHAAIVLCLTKEDYKIALDDWGIDWNDVYAGWPEPPNSMRTCYIDSKTNGKLIAVLVDESQISDSIDLATCLVHEAVHIFQYHCEYIGEEKPSSEFEAYSIQRISETLMRAYSEQKNLK